MATEEELRTRRILVTQSIIAVNMYPINNLALGECSLTVSTYQRVTHYMLGTTRASKTQHSVALISTRAVTEGQVYIITNPSFPEWVKVGMAVNAEDHLRGYQTSSPFRDYELFYSWSVNDRRTVETEAHSILKEWFSR